MKRMVALVCLAALMIASMGSVSAASIGYRKNELSIISEPGEANKSYVEYYDGDKKLSLNDIEWVEGRYGKGVKLTGDGHLVLVNHLPLSVTTCTFAGWFQWNGEEVDGKKAENQHFFTFYRGNESMLTIYPNAVDDKGNALGNRLVLSRDQRKEPDLDLRLTDTDGNLQAWEVGRWHHLALVIDGQYLKYYIDGVLQFESLWLLDFAQLRFSYLLIGDNHLGNPNLNAIVDEVSLFDVALEEETIQRLMYGIPITDESTPTPTTTTTTTTREPTMTTTTTTTTAPTTTTTEFVRDVTDLSSPSVWIPIAVGGAALILIIICWPTKKKAKPEEAEQEPPEETKEDE